MFFITRPSHSNSVARTLYSFGGTSIYVNSRANLDGKVKKVDVQIRLYRESPDGA